MNILIAGGTGLIGTELCKQLAAKGHSVSLLSRHPQKNGPFKQFSWDPKKGELDTDSLFETEAIINLAGAGVAEKRWTEAYKKEIMESRTLGAQLLLRYLATSKHHVRTYISASGISYYGIDTGDKLMNEESPKGDGFLAEVVLNWEKEALEAQKLGVRTVCLRTGVVLSKQGGALPKMALPVKLFVGSPFGSGHQYFSWIDLDDLVRLYIFVLENTEVEGIYNAVSPQPVTNKEFTQLLASQLNKPLWAPHVPSWALSLAVGEMSQTLLGGNKVASKKIEQAGFQFKAPTVEASLSKQLA